MGEPTTSFQLYLYLTPSLFTGLAMVCGYRDKLSAGNRASPLMSCQLICGHFLYICRSKGITGKEVTPFLLQKLVELTDGKSLDSSILLLMGGKRKYFSVSPISDNAW